MARANAERGARRNCRQQVRENDSSKRRELAGSERHCCLLHLDVELDQHRLHRAHHERKSDEQQRDDDPRTGVRELEPDWAVDPVEREQHESRDDRREREWQVDQSVDDPLAAEVVAHEHPRDQRPDAWRSATATNSALATVSRIAAAASGVVAASQNDANPFCCPRHTTAAERNEHEQAEPQRCKADAERGSGVEARQALAPTEGRIDAAVTAASANRHPDLLLDGGHDAARRIEELLRHIGPSAEVGDGEEPARVSGNRTGSRRPRAPVGSRSRRRSSVPRRRERSRGRPELAQDASTTT